MIKEEAILLFLLIDTKIMRQFSIEEINNNWNKNRIILFEQLKRISL
ncbi:MAG: hypothetical protein HeimC3_09810 [Candidatus Heimdallarchaeota archaeon LC_3]|nr:MAG: hypothetical protein HeimC3_09810 [Candidatus Heimdallarchaeota archaeon LC_3]